MAKKRARGRDVEAVPLDQLADIDQIDRILLGAINGTPQEVHEAIRQVLKDRPGRKPREVYRRFRRLKSRELKKRNGHIPWQRTEWRQEDIEFVRTHYGQGLVAARWTVNDLRIRRPELSPRAIHRMAAKLGQTNLVTPGRPWTKTDDGLLGYHAGEKGVSFLIKKFGRTPTAIRKRLSGLGLSAKVPLPDYFNLRQISIMLGVSDSIVRTWYEKGLFKPYGKIKLNGHARSKVLIHKGALVAFSVAHPQKLNLEKCHPDVKMWLEKNGKTPPQPRNGSREH
jgi:predicted DNA-binding antitoxin AbrB/MazE fold protein